MTLWRVRALLSILVLTSLMPAILGAAEPMTKVKVGELAPDFTLPDQNNKPVKLSEFSGGFA